MKNYTNECKLKEVLYCLSGNKYSKTARKFNIAYYGTVERWVKRYEKYGLEGLKENKRKKDGKFKENVVEYKKKKKLSLRETAYEFDIGSLSTIIKWEKLYDEKGAEALYGKEGKVIMKIKKEKSELEKLREENELLRMENEYLKKLNALVQERKKKEKK